MGTLAASKADIMKLREESVVPHKVEKEGSFLEAPPVSENKKVPQYKTYSSKATGVSKPSTIG